MAGKITFDRRTGGLGRPLDGRDHYSGMIFYTNTLPSGFASDDRIKQVFSLQEAEDLGIVDDFSDETKASTGGTVQITTPGAVGETQSIKVQGGYLGSYIFVSGDLAADVATGLAAAINARTYLHGWTASSATDTVTVVPPDGLGALNNGGSNLSFSSIVTATGAAGTGAATVTQLSGGVTSYFAVMHYQISEFFRLQPKGVLWIGIYAEKTYDGAELKTIQDFAIGEIRQTGVFISHEVATSAHITGSQTYLNTLENENRPMSVVITSDYTGITFANLSDLSTLNSKRVSVVIGQDGNWNIADYVTTKAYKIGDKVNYQGATYVNKKASTDKSPYENTYWTKISTNLADLSGFTVGSVGTGLGTVSLSKVNENIGYVERFALTSGNILDEAGFVTGELFKDLSTGQKTTLENKRYIYLLQHDGITGTFFSDSWTCIVSSSDFATIENNRTIDKAIRNTRTFQVPKINSPLYVISDGKLTEQTIQAFKNLAIQPMEQMEIDGEVSAYRVEINPDQNVISTSKITTSIEIVPVGVAREINNVIGFVVAIT